ncbi:putative aldouronate transport system permease protein [Paenibacillus sp. UNCCL117]|uniref:ABC transporter permease n=1 Tax=unclassified Paenibacillus TaxID=185978 RepID=UPI000880D4D0|nr:MULTISPECIES: ABC transporter permease subunit [unclassified Paenibacillus]SDC15179.1 putative aldouronate transport system permease protein [Paenibacillus sp. cl123]SFW17486.1 putative aldouronate transport system permease protein [Paenibacillus sp. UNCCL117]
MTAATEKAAGKGLVPRSIRKNWDLYLLVLPVVLYFLLIKYLPMYGIQLAFKDFSAAKGFLGSEWVGFKHFIRFFSNYQFWTLIQNTIGISLLEIIFGFPIPILFALFVNEVRVKWFKKTVQSITFMPHFLSTVVLVGMVMAFLSPTTGLVNNVIRWFGEEPIYFMTEPGMFKPIYVFSGVWQNMGFSSILYIAVLAGIDKHLYEAAMIDGATKLQRLLHIAIPCLIPTATIMLIFQFGSIMDIGFEKIFLMQNELNITSSNVISTYVYEMGLLGSQFSFSSAVGLFNSVINFVLIVIVNQAAKRIGDTSLW